MTNATRKAGPPEWRNLLNVIVLAFAVGALVALYVVWVRHMTVHRSISNAVEQAAITAAKNLTRVSLQDQTFGRVGLCDLAAIGGSGGEPAQPRTIGLNTLYATLRVNAIIARKIRNPLMMKLVQADFERAKQIKRELATRLYHSVEPNPYRTYPYDEAGSNYQQVSQVLASESSQGKRKLVTVKLELGSLEGGDLPCVTHAPRPSGGHDSVSKNGCYRPLRPIPVNGYEPVHFYPLADNVTLTDPARFRLDQSDVIPSAVIVTATYKSGSGGDSPARETEQVRQACALVGAPAVHLDPCAFMLNFPNGPPPQFESIATMFVRGRWLKAGQWQQAIGADVPGEGSLGPLAEDDPGDMMPCDALVMALYHWLRYLGPDVDPDRVVALFEQRCLNAQSNRSESQEGDASYRPQPGEQAASINSCLVRETGARQYAILNQTGSGGAGQTAIANAFGAAPSDQVRPASALPLSVDTYGNVNLPGHRGFDKELVSNFFQALYMTNLAGIESQSTARSVIDRAESRVKQIERRIILDNEELSSLKQRRENMTPTEEPAPAVASRLLILEDRVAALEESIKNSGAERRKFQNAIQLAQIVVVNGEKASLKSFDICSRMSRLATGGLDLASSPRRIYLLSKKWLFVPHVTPVSEEEIIGVASGKTPEKSCEWLSAEFNVFQELGDQSLIPKVDNQGLAGSQSVPPAAVPTVIIMDSEQVKSGRAPRLKLFRHSPFGNVGVPLGQLFYYSEDTLVSGGSVKLAWSVVLRDLVAFRTDRTRGEAQPSQDSGWCRQSGIPETSCPGLACEFQVCSPLPIVPDFQTDIYLTNPTSLDRASLVPPVPSGMI